MRAAPRPPISRPPEDKGWRRCENASPPAFRGNLFARRTPISDFLNPPKKGAARTANGIFQAWEKRTELVKLQVNAESAANDAKTIRLRALRLEKEALDAEAARLEALNAPPSPVKKRSKNSG